MRSQVPRMATAAAPWLRDRVPYGLPCCKRQSSHLAFRPPRPPALQQLQQLQQLLQQPSRCHPLRCHATAQAAAATTAKATPPPARIVTIGWLGARAKPFSKYAALWQSLGYCDVTSVRPPLASIVLPQLGKLAAARVAAQLIHGPAPAAPAAPGPAAPGPANAAAAPAAAAEAAAATEPTDLLIHLFSGGGYIFASWLLQQLASEGGPSQVGRVRGIVLDSSPAQVIPDVASRALVAAVLGEPAEGVSLRHPLLVGGVGAAVAGYLRLPHIRADMAAVHEAWHTVVPPVPMLFLHSAGDALVPPEVVQSFAKQQEARGAPTSSVMWRDSPHCDHWRAHPAEYEEQLRQFAARALGPDGAAAGGGRGQGDAGAAAGGDGWRIRAARPGAEGPGA